MIFDLIRRRRKVLVSCAVVATAVVTAPTHGQCDPSELFLTPPAYPVGARPSSVAIGDLDGDGIPDLAVANRTTDDVSVLIGNGDGTFATQVTSDDGDRPYFVEIGDLNGDGAMDLAVTNPGDDTVSVLLNQCDSTDCAADLDGDGDLDSKDFFAYLELFANGDDGADIDGDGVIDADDFFGFLDLFAAGC